jgi:hypothetical protein
MVEKIGYTASSSAIARAQRSRRKGDVSGASFIEALERAGGVEEADAVEASTPIAATVGMAGLLGIQEMSDEEASRRRQMKHGRMTLEALESLRDALLVGSLPLATIRDLERIVSEERGRVHDPVLSGILDEIELRAAVELAKLQRAKGRL